MASDYTQIVKLYTDAEKQLLAAVEKTPTSGTSKAYMQRLLKRVQKVLKDLRADSSRLSSEVVKQAYYDGIKDVQRAISKGPSLSVELHDFDSAVDALAEETDAYYRKAIAATGRRINDEIRETLSAATEKKFSEWQTIQEMRRDLLKSLQNSTTPAVIGVETRNGRVVPLKSYASMAARTSVAEAQNRAKVMYCLQSDIDLLKCSKHTPTCEICSLYQDRVYALTKEAAAGKYKGPNGEPLRFPYIYDTVFVDGYETIHPNCRHRMSPFVAEAYTPEEVAEYSRQSMQPFADVRSDAERKAYQASQVKNNRRRADMKQYLRYKDRLGADKVPKTLAAFRSIKSMNGDAWDNLQSEYRFSGIIERILKKNNGIRIFENPEDIPDEYNDCAQMLSEELKEGIYHYSHYEEGKAMNIHLGNPEENPLDAETEQYMLATMEALKRGYLPYDTVLWRGAEMQYMNGFDDIPKQLSGWKGRHISYKGFSSTSIIQNASYMNLGLKDLQMIILKRALQPGTMYIEDISYNKANNLQSEYEVLLQSAQEYVIIEAQKFKGKTIVVVEAI